MRGNEKRRSQSARPYSAFSIPMRGNEILIVALVVAFIIMFSIPMRGNERGSRCDGTAPRASGFSIPMRGNETESGGVVTVNYQDVFDPHEG